MTDKSSMSDEAEKLVTETDTRSANNVASLAHAAKKLHDMLAAEEERPLGENLVGAITVQVAQSLMLDDERRGGIAVLELILVEFKTDGCEAITDVGDVVLLALFDDDVLLAFVR
jgi:hypothetical protein